MSGLLHTLHQAHSFYEQGHAATHIKHSYQQFAAIPSVQTAWNFGGNVVGVIGTERVVGALVKYGVKMAIKSRAVDQNAGREMVELMKSRVPVDTGKLLSGITMEDDGEVITVSASAARDGDADYARFVEFGTRGSSVADSEFFDSGANAGAALHPRTGQGGAAAQPYFWNSARETLAKYKQELSQVIDETTSEEGF